MDAILYTDFRSGTAQAKKEPGGFPTWLEKDADPHDRRSSEELLVSHATLLVQLGGKRMGRPGRLAVANHERHVVGVKRRY